MNCQLLFAGLFHCTKAILQVELCITRGTTLQLLSFDFPNLFLEINHPFHLKFKGKSKYNILKKRSAPPGENQRAGETKGENGIGNAEDAQSAHRRSLIRNATLKD
jgi:hypothetical protein